MGMLVKVMDAAAKVKETNTTANEALSMYNSLDASGIFYKGIILAEDFKNRKEEIIVGIDALIKGAEIGQFIIDKEITEALEVWKLKLDEMKVPLPE